VRLSVWGTPQPDVRWPAQTATNWGAPRPCLTPRGQRLRLHPDMYTGKGKSMSGQRVGYQRVSSLEQNPQRQLDGIVLDQTYTDRLSGKNIDRPQLSEMLRFVRAEDTVVVHSLDRLARNLDDLRRLINELTGRGVRVEFLKEQLTFTGEDNAMAQLLLSVMGAFAEFERSLIRERQREGVALAKARGAYRGRKRILSEDRIAELRQRAAAGEPKATLAREFGVSRETVYQYLRAQSSTVELAAPDAASE